MRLVAFVWRKLIVFQISRVGVRVLRHELVGKIGDRNITVSYINYKVRIFVGGVDVSNVNGVHLHLVYRWFKKYADERIREMSAKYEMEQAILDEIRYASRNSASYQQVMRQVEEERGNGEVEESPEPL